MIDYYRGILQGDLLSLILFVLAVNLVSHLLSKEEGFKLTIEDQIRIITHLFFVDDLKLYASTLAKMKKLLDIVIQFTNDVGMSFGESKCAYQAIERGKRKEHNEPLKMKGLTIKEIENGDHYTYLGVDLSVGILGPLNKQRVTKEYKTRLQKIWSSELNGRNKTIAHNTFAVPIITSSVGILDWTNKEVKDLDVMARKIISMNGGFHTASDVNRLYADRKKGGRGLRSIEDMLESRAIGIMQHLEQASNTNTLLKMVKINERQGIMRLGKEFEKRIKDRQGDGKVTISMSKDHEDRWKDKVTHGYLTSQLEKDEHIDKTATNNWLQLRFSAHIEGYLMAVQKQELDTKATRKRREEDEDKKRKMGTRCRACHENEESVFHSVCSCPHLAPTLYLETRHNQTARIIHQELLQNDKLDFNPQRVTQKDQLELWWEIDAKTVTKVKKNKPDMMLWDREQKTCQLIEITVPLDTNLKEAYHLKEIKYIPLISEMQRLYKEYKFSTTIITIGALGAVPKILKHNLEKLPLPKERIDIIIQRIQRAALP